MLGASISKNVCGSKVWGHIINALLAIIQLYSFLFRQNTLIIVIEQETREKEDRKLNEWA